MPNILVKTKFPFIVPMLNQGKKPGYELIQVDRKESFDNMNKYKDVHAIIIDYDMTNPPQIQRIKEMMDDAMFPVVLISSPEKEMENQEAGMWLGCGVSDIFQLPMPAPMMGKRLGSLIQLYCVTQSLHGQVTDKLTGLHNRNAFYHFAKRMIESSPEDDYTVVLSDIEYFKRINERYGEASGDQLLKYVGKSLNRMNNENILFARYGGDQFVGMIRQPKEQMEMNPMMMEKSMEEFYKNAPISPFTVQFGIYNNVDKNLPISIMCDKALMALKTIKHQYGHNIAMYTPQLQQKFNREQQIHDSMEQAIRENQFMVYYQPKHDVRTSKLVGAEALVRWQHPVYGFMSPSEFIPLFEQSGFITEMDKYVWKRVCSNVIDALERNIPMVPISINASRKDFLNGDVIQYVTSSLNRLHLDSKLFHMEITETAYVEDEDLVFPLIGKLREHGIKVEMDDFGSGLSSLGSVSKLPVDIIKLDINMIRNMESQPAIVDSVIHLMHNLGYEVTAEGVENDRQVCLLKEMGCDNIQGYYYSKPLTYEGFIEYILTQKNSRD